MGRAEQRSIVAKVRVYELAKEFGVESKVVMTKLEEMGEFVRSASSTIEAPVARRPADATRAAVSRAARATAAAMTEARPGCLTAPRRPAVLPWFLRLR